MMRVAIRPSKHVPLVCSVSKAAKTDIEIIEKFGWALTVFLESYPIATFRFSRTWFPMRSNTSSGVVGVAGEIPNTISTTCCMDGSRHIRSAAICSLETAVRLKLLQAVLVRLERRSVPPTAL
jgi:hypothetical protein